MTVSVPEAWTYTTQHTQHGVDFIVHSLQELSDFGSSAGNDLNLGSAAPLF